MELEEADQMGSNSDFNEIVQYHIDYVFILSKQQVLLK